MSNEDFTKSFTQLYNGCLTEVQQMAKKEDRDKEWGLMNEKLQFIDEFYRNWCNSDQKDLIAGYTKSAFEKAVKESETGYLAPMAEVLEKVHGIQKINNERSDRVSSLLSAARREVASNGTLDDASKLTKTMALNKANYHNTGKLHKFSEVERQAFDADFNDLVKKDFPSDTAQKRFMAVINLICDLYEKK